LTLTPEVIMIQKCITISVCKLAIDN